MKLSTLEFIKLLPVFMRDDLAVKGLAKGIDEIVPDLAESIKVLTIWDRIEDLTEQQLDELAWELNILWYDKATNIEAKRDLINNSDQVYKHMGTKWAVENVIQTYFGDGFIQEWFQYEGTPGHFRVYSTNPTLNNEKLTEFLNILGKVKRYSAVLDGIYITLAAQLNLGAGVAVSETSRETYKIGAIAI